MKLEINFNILGVKVHILLMSSSELSTPDVIHHRYEQQPDYTK